jgi:hypothetical protein
MSYELSTSFYIGAFVILVVIIMILLIISPTQNSFFDLKEKYPILYYNLHHNSYVYNNIIKEIVSNTGVKRADMEELKYTNAPIQWLDYSVEQYTYIRGDVQILPLYYNNQYYENYKCFPLLMQLLQVQPNILNVFFWKLSDLSGLLQHTPKKQDGTPNIHETNILDIHKKNGILRYTLAINVLSCAEDECSLWVNGQLKKLVFDRYLLWNPLLEFSLHNESATDGDILFLNIDICN